MKTSALIFAVLSAFMPVIGQRTGLSDRYGFKMKMLCAFMYLTTGILSALSLQRVTAYSLIILGALVSGVLGDFFLSYKNDKYFPVGMGFFALGHIAYIVAFLSLGQGKSLYYTVPLLLLTAVLYGCVLMIIRRLKFKKYGKMLMLYSAVLVLFFSCALVMGVFSLIKGKVYSGLSLIIGGALFFASDVMIGIGKGGIKRPEFLQNAVSYTYFAAQTLFAVSMCFQ